MMCRRHAQLRQGHTQYLAFQHWVCNLSEPASLSVGGKDEGRWQYTIAARLTIEKVTRLRKPSVPDSAGDTLTLMSDAVGIWALVVRKLWSCEQSATSFRICAALCTLAPMPPLMPTACANAPPSAMRHFRTTRLGPHRTPVCDCTLK